MAINFPLKLSFSVTSHKIQGQTVHQPKSVVLNFKNSNFAGQANVMLSRAESMDQLIILDELYDHKWKVSEEALKEVQRIEKNALNHQMYFNTKSVNVLSLNIRSLRTNFKHLAEEPHINELDIICLQETWFNHNESESFELQGFDSFFNSDKHWRGNGIANYFNNSFHAQQSVWSDKFQMTKVTNKELT